MLLASSGFLTLLAIGVWLFALFDAVTCPEDKVRNLQKVLWVIVVLLFFVFGAALWFAFGRPRSVRPGSFGGARRPGPIAPDDDPDFLRGLNQPRRDGNDPTSAA